MTYHKNVIDSDSSMKIKNKDIKKFKDQKRKEEKKGD